MLLWQSTQEQRQQEKRFFSGGVLYGIIPHAGCIAFILASILGATVLVEFFKPLLMSRNFFYTLILISLLFATLSATIYLKRNGLLSRAGIKKKWKYLATMFGTTIGINLLFFLVLFPLLANFSSAAGASTISASSIVASQNPGLQANQSQAYGSVPSNSLDGLDYLKLKVSIPCSGHAPLISGELKKLSGVQDVKFSFPNFFEINYDSFTVSKSQILALSVFKEYPAAVVSETAALAGAEDIAQPAASGTCKGSSAPASGCGGAGSGCGGGCGGSCSGCGNVV